MTLFIFILGTIIGSFLNVCIFRIPQNQSIAYPPSTCGSCSAKLKPIDLIPLLSYILIKGKCRYCKSKFSIRYPLIELLTGLIFLLSYHAVGLEPVLIKYLFLSSILIIISFIDIEYQIIPDRLVLFTMLIGIVLNIYTKDITFLSSLIGLAIGGGLLLLIALLTNGAMGGGDIKLMAVMGYYIGWPATIMALFISFVLGGIVGILLILFKLKSRKDLVPFGPFLALGTIVSALYYHQILYLYLTTVL